MGTVNMTDEAAKAFHEDMLRGCELLKDEIGYNPTRFLQMVSAHGGVEAVKRLLVGSDGSDGFTKLWEHNRLNLSAEAHVLLPWYSSLFTEKEREKARQRLEEHGFDVDAFLEHRSHSAPQWVTDHA